MISVDIAESFESSQDILKYLRFAGYDLTSDQLARLHRRRLISVHQPSRTSGSLAPNYPGGTAERILRILQLRQNTKQLDELAWRLWWEGFTIEPDLVRAYLFRKASRWDEQLSESEDSPPVASHDSAQSRDVLDDVFFKHLKEAPTHNALRRQLERGSALFSEFAGLFLDSAHLSRPTKSRSSTDLFPSRDESHLYEAMASSASPGVKELPLELDFNVPFSKVVDAIRDEELEPARLVARRVLSSIAAVGHVVQDVFTSSARGRENVGRNLVVMADSPNEQILSVLLTATYLRSHPNEIDAVADDVILEHQPAVSFGDHRRLLYLAQVVPQLSALLGPERVSDVFHSGESAIAWREEFYRLQHEYLIEFELASDLESELFDDDSPPGDDDDEDYWVISKKKILSDGRRHRK